MSARPGILIGVDVGSTTMSGGLVTPAGDILTTSQNLTHRDGLGTVLESLRCLVSELLGDARARRLSIQGIGIGLSGMVDAEAGAMRKGIERFPELTGFSLAELLRAETGYRVYIDNDVNALALGEWTWGLGRDSASLVVLAIGSGVGGGVILDGRLLRGHAGAAGEFGHVSVNLDGRVCVCGARGCLGAYVAGYGVATEAARRAGGASPRTGPVQPGQEDLWSLDAEPVFRKAAEGDGIARAIIEEACQALGAGLGGIVNGLNPELIVLTGGVTKSLVAWEGAIRDHLAAYALAPALAETRIAFVPRHKSQTVLGGAALVLYEQSRANRGQRRKPCPSS
jgi:glucokinase